MSGAAPTEAASASAGRLAIPAQQQQFLAFDFGSKRTGVASGNRLLGQASPVTTIQAEGAEARFAAVQQLLAQWQPQALVIGVPYHPDGAAHENTARALKFGRQLRGRLAYRSMRSMSAIPPPKPWPWAQKMPTRRPPASSWTNF